MPARRYARQGSGLLVSLLLLGCNGIVVGVENGTGGGPEAGFGGAEGPSLDNATDYSQRPEPRRFCWFMNSMQEGLTNDAVLYEVDLVTGEWGARRYLSRYPQGAGLKTIAVHRGELIWNTEWAMASFHLETGAFRSAQFGTVGFTSNGEEIVSSCPDGTTSCVYGSIDALWDLQPSRTLPIADPLPEGFAEDPASLAFALGTDILYVAPFFGNVVYAYDKDTGAPLHTVQLENVPEGDTLGLAVVEDRLLLRLYASFDPNDTRISIHDAVTGENVNNVYLGPAGNSLTMYPRGLICGGTFD